MAERLRRLAPALSTLVLALVLVALTLALVGLPTAAGSDDGRGRCSPAYAKSSLGGGPPDARAARAPCVQVPDLIVGEGVITGTTQGGTTVMTTYACNPQLTESGPELVFELVPPAGGPWVAAAELTYASADLDLFVLSPSCDSGSCVAFGESAVSFHPEPNQSYFLVIDGALGVAGAFTLEVRYSDLSATPQVGVASALLGKPGAGGNVPYRVEVWNEGPGPALTVIVTESFVGMTRLYSASPFAVVTQTVGGETEVGWLVGSMEAGSHYGWDAFASIDAPVAAGVAGAHVVTLENPLGDDPGNNTSVITATVSALDADVAVLAAPAWDGAVPGAELPWIARVCNEGGTASPEVVATTTLSLGSDIQLIDWWSDQAGWLEAGSTQTEVTATRGSLANQDCGLLLVRSRLRADLPLGTWVCAHVSVPLGNDPDPGDNQALACAEVGKTLFADGFETGRTWLWSHTAP